jgi:amino acid adenylation domain-containing protein
MKNVEDIYPLSPVQEGMLFHTLYTPGSGTYHTQITGTLRGEIDSHVFEQAWRCVIHHYAALRTAFIWENLKRPLQVVRQSVPLTLQLLNWRDKSPSDQQAELAKFLKHDRLQGFDLARAPVMRLALIQLADDTHEFIWSFHHLILDGWSTFLVLADVDHAYEALRRGKVPELAPSPPYRNYISWLQQQSLSQAEAFWKETLRGYSNPVPLPLECSQHVFSAEQVAYDEVHAYISATTTTALQVRAQQHALTLNTIVQGIWALLLSRYSREHDIVFGVTVSGRPPELSGVESMVGLFINTLPLRVSITPEAGFFYWLQELQAHQVEVSQYEYSSLLDIHKWSDVPGDLPLFESILVFENYPLEDSIQKMAGSLNTLGIRNFEQTNYPLTLVVFQENKQLSLRISYDCNRFEARAITHLVDHLRNMLETIAVHPELRVTDLLELSEAEKRQILHDWNATEAPYPDGLLITDLVTEEARKRPEAVALVYEDCSMSYEELEVRSNQLAHYLHSLGVRAETLVGLCLERSMALIIGLLAILKAGGVYVPLDPHSPHDRLAFLLDNAQIPILLTQQRVYEQFPLFKGTLIAIDSIWDTLAQQCSDELARVATADNLAYVIYTSGSTGMPKGVQVTHKALVNHTRALRSIIGVMESDRLLHFIDFSFDASTGEIFNVLAAGATLVLHPGPNELSSSELLRFCNQQAITILDLPTAMWHQLVTDASILRLRPSPPIRVFMVGGESPSLDKLRLLSSLVEQPENTLFLTSYGPTETTITATTFTTWLSPHIIAGISSLPIGRPLPNVKVYVLDKQMQPVPAGVPGELYIGGIGVSRGYLMHPEWTAERFVPDPFSGNPGGRLYRTGDLARFAFDGSLEFLGRIDQQVKLRGFRVEPGEIEAVLAKQPGVKEAVVVAREDPRGDKCLVAYIVATPGVRLSQSTLRQALRERVPTYMVPSLMMFLDALPLTPNGKIDRQALPPPDWSLLDENRIDVPPRTPIEELLAQVWKEVLGVEHISIEDDFFALGGHSLLAMRVISRVRELLPYEVPLRALFEARTVARLAQVIEEISRQTHTRSVPQLQPLPRPEHIPLSFAQEHFWFLAQLEPNNPFYNVPLALRLHGILEVEALQASLQAIVQRHEVLRTTFQLHNGQPYQVIAPYFSIDLPIIDLSALSPDAQESRIVELTQAEARKPFDLQKDFLLRASLLRLSHDSHILLLTFHHIVTDGWSQEILYRELSICYRANRSGIQADLPSLPIQYADYALWQRQWLRGSLLQEHLSFWTNLLSGAPTILGLPTDKPRPATQRYQGQTITSILPASLLADLQALSQEAACSLFVTLLSGFAILLARMSAQQDLLIGTVVAGRSVRELEALIGCFVNTLALRIDLTGNPDVKQLLQRVRTMTLDAFMHQDVPFEHVVEALQIERDASRNPLIQVLFILQNASSTTPMPETELHIEVQPIEIGVSKFDLVLVAIETEGELQLVLEYNSDLFIAENMLRLLEHYQRLLKSMVAEPQERISYLEWLLPAERQQLLTNWNATNVPYSSERCIHQLFEDQIQRTPNALALVSEDSQLTYQELDQRANQLAHYLQGQGVGPDVLVGICMERSPDMIVALMATLKAGGAYLPLDPRYPRERLDMILQDSHPAVLLTQSTLRAILSSCEAQTLSIDSEWEKAACESKAAPPCATNADNLVYVIYTSGSTGRPKGVLISHRGLCNVIQAQIDAFAVSAASRIMQFASFSFDAAASEIFVALLSGASLYLAPSSSLLPGPSLLQLLREKQITTITLPPSALALLPVTELPDLRTLIVAGEECPVPLAKQWSKYCRVLNGYGPSEISICATIAECDINSDRLPIGRPIINTRIYVLDAFMQLVPIGIPGELCIGGPGVARGYLHRPDLTAERFVPDPFGAHPGSRLYKSGDLVRYRPDGQLEFLGRIDRQVKLRGFRIEPGEIEAVLHSQPEIQEAAVLLHENTPEDKQLVAYIVLRDGHILREADLRQRLREVLPDYMLPSHITLLDALPLSPNGKIDRQALPKPNREWRLRTTSHVGPRDSIEWSIAQIWERLLNIKLVGVRENFFQIGGNSLLAVRLMADLESTFGIKLPLNTLFQGNTIEYLASLVRQQRDASATWQTLVQFYPSSRNMERLPFFCVHPSSGDTFAYADLARCIGPDQPFYAFQSRGLDGKQEPLESIEAMAGYYISLLRSVQPRGPYLIGGWSMGGIVAYEMAQQLSTQGESVALLAMLDATILPAVEGGDKEMVYAWMGKDLPWEQFMQLNEEEQAGYLLEYMRRIGFELPTTDVLLFRNHMRLFEINSRAVSYYTPSPYNGTMTVFRCREASAHIPPDLGWGKFVRGLLEIHEVPGNHHSMMDYPHVEELAHQLRACLDKTLQSRYLSTSCDSRIESKR